jgi:hypothetical protein
MIEVPERDNGQQTTKEVNGTAFCVDSGDLRVVATLVESSGI